MKLRIATLRSALAGLRRLGLEQHVTEVLPVDLCLPAARQGAVAVEVISGSQAETAVAPLSDEGTARCVRAERALLRRLGGGCSTPIGAYAVQDGPLLWLRAGRALLLETGIPGAWMHPTRRGAK